MMMMVRIMMMMIHSFVEWLADQNALTLYTVCIAALKIAVWGSEFPLTRKSQARLEPVRCLISDSAKWSGRTVITTAPMSKMDYCKMQIIAKLSLFYTIYCICLQSVLPYNVLFSLAETFPGLLNCKSVFPILIICQYVGLRWWIQLFSRYSFKN